MDYDYDMDHNDYAQYEKYFKEEENQMSNLVKGKITNIGKKDGKTKKGKVWKLLSCKIDGVWYSCGFNVDLDASEGDFVKFSWDLDDRDNKLIDMDSFEISSPPSSSDSDDGDSGESKDVYWAKKDVRSRIGYARAAAIDLVKLSLEQDILPWTKSAKADAKFDLLTALVDKTTLHFYNMTEDQIVTIFDEDDDDDLPMDVVVGDDNDDGDDLDD